MAVVVRHRSGPRFADNARRVQQRPALHAVIAEVFAVLFLAQVVERLEWALSAHAALRNNAPPQLDPIPTLGEQMPSIFSYKEKPMNPKFVKSALLHI